MLAPGGRIVMCEPYISPMSWPVYRFFHEEPLDLGVDPLALQGSAGDGARDPFDANQAIPTLLFGRERGGVRGGVSGAGDQARPAPVRLQLSGVGRLLPPAVPALGAVVAVASVRRARPGGADAVDGVSDARRHRACVIQSGRVHRPFRGWIRVEAGRAARVARRADGGAALPRSDLADLPDRRRRERTHRARPEPVRDPSIFTTFLGRTACPPRSPGRWSWRRCSGRRRTTGAARSSSGLGVFSHFVFDFVTHRPDLPLYPGSPTSIGLGLWNRPAATLAVESALYVVGVAIYARTTRAINWRGIDRVLVCSWSLLGLFYAMTVFGPPPSSVDVHQVRRPDRLAVSGVGLVDRPQPRASRRGGTRRGCGGLASSPSSRLCTGRARPGRARRGERHAGDRRQHGGQRGADLRRRADVVVVDALEADERERARHQRADHRVAADQRTVGREDAGQTARRARGVGDVLEDGEADDGVVVVARGDLPGADRRAGTGRCSRRRPARSARTPASDPFPCSRGSGPVSVGTSTPLPTPTSSTRAPPAGRRSRPICRRWR